MLKIEVDEERLASKFNKLVDIPYVPESAEEAAFRAGVRAGVEAAVRIATGSELLADYGVTVTA